MSTRTSRTDWARAPSLMLPRPSTTRQHSVDSSGSWPAMGSPLAGTASQALSGAASHPRSLSVHGSALRRLVSSQLARLNSLAAGGLGLGLGAGEEVAEGPDGRRVLFRGLRVRMGLHTGEVPGPQHAAEQPVLPCSDPTSQ